jgi:serine phosphatase RsbU (regulator of sigma subunit)/pSer/pThr/pTyr-binding forkhead associated (FHA) protein
MSQSPELLVRPLHGEPFRVPVDKDVVSIGRSKRNHLVLADQWLSRHHAEIRHEGGSFYIYDLDSRNGTLVNGVRITRKVPLQDGDVVTLGDQTLTFVQEPTGSVILSESSAGDLDLDGTVVVPTEHLLAVARGREDTWDSIRGQAKARQPSSASGDSSAIVRQNQILSALSQASMALISDRPLNELLDYILELAFKVVKAERGALMLTNGGESGLEVKAVRSSSDKDGKGNEEITFSRSIAEKVIGEKVSILTSNAMTDPRFQSQDSIVSFGIRSAMCAPLWNNKNVTGLIYVDRLIHESVFTEDDLSLLASLANVAAIKLENAKLVEEMIEKKRMEHELALAGDIQKNLLPAEAPDLAGWDIAGTNTPCYTIGGDYYDFINRPNDRMAFALGDVSGKGAAAALMMAVLRATVQSATQKEGDMVSIVSHTNRVMFHNSPEHAYVTFFLSDLDPKSGELLYINAGHIPPILYRAESGTVERLEEGGTVLGMFEAVPFEQGKIELKPGDALVVFTDGISESWGEDGEEYGEDRLGEIVKKKANLSAQELMDVIEQEVDAYATGRPTDDRTLIVVKRT